MSYETITLKNGLRVANFNSPHPFVFDDGTVLPATTNQHSKDTMLLAHEEEIDNWSHDIITIKLTYSLTARLMMEIDTWMIKYDNEKVDIVIIPFPMLQLVKDYMKSKHDIDILKTPFRVCRFADRITKTLCSNKFCV